jgi:manganese transport protein
VEWSGHAVWSMADDLYQLSPDHVLEAPRKFRDRLKHLGPGFILSASIVGSGELIATTTLGAKAGFICLWVVLFSCLVKVTLQIEFGKHAIYSGKTSMGGLCDMPGPRLGKGHWSVWSWLVMMLLKSMQSGGVLGLLAFVLMDIAPVGGAGNSWGLLFWSLVCGLIASLLVRRGSYGLIERWCLIMIGIFTVVTLVSVISLQSTPLAISGEELVSGLTPNVPPGALLIVALAAFGITGVGGDEIIAYNYWLLEKGYARHTGPRPDRSDVKAHAMWMERARGWITVMKADALLSMVCYTIVTALFYLLGAAVLHRQGTVPTSNDLVPTLASMYTESLGSWARWVFLIGALVVLFSTLLSALAAWTRQFSDAFSEVGWGDFHNPVSRGKFIGILAFVFPAWWIAQIFAFRAFDMNPAMMVIFGGAATTSVLLLVVLATFFMRTRWLPAELKPGRLYDAALILSGLAICGVGVYAVWGIADKLSKL